MAFSTRPNACSPSRLFPPEDKAPWEKAHGRLDRRRVARVAVSPEEIGLCGCWQVIALKRESLDLTKADAQPTVEIGYYAASLSLQEYDDAGIQEIIRGHWSAIENGTHYRRDVTLGEDACRTANRQGAEVLASLRNLANGLYELARARGRTKVDTLKSWCQQQTFSSAWPLLRRKPNRRGRGSRTFWQISSAKLVPGSRTMEILGNVGRRRAIQSATARQFPRGYGSSRSHRLRYPLPETR